jgi:hypothetical protein
MIMRSAGSSSTTSTVSPWSARGASGVSVRRAGHLFLPVVARQVDAHRRALAHLGVDAHLPARLLGEAVDHGQPQARAHADGLGREEGVEGARHHLRGHAHAVVAHGERHVLPHRQVAPARGARVDPAVGGFNHQLAALGHGVARVDAQVEQRVLQLPGVGVHVPQPDRGHVLQFDLRAERAAQQLFHVAHQPVGVDGLGLQRLAAREGQQPVRERGGALHRALRHADVALHVGGLALQPAPVHQLQAAADGRQQVVEVVRQAARELAHGLELLALAQLLARVVEFGRALLLLRDVACGGVEQAVVGHRGPRQPAVGAGLGAVAVLEARGARADQQARQFGLGGREVVGMHEVAKRQRADLFRAPAQHGLPGRVHADEVAVEVGHAQQVLAQRPGAVALVGAGLDLQFERIGQRLQLDLRLAPRDGRAHALADLAHEVDLVLRPGTFLPVVQVQQANQAAALRERHVDDRARGDGDERLGVVPRALVGMGIGKGHRHPALQVLDVAAVVAKVQQPRQAGHARGGPVALDGDGLRGRVHQAVAGTVDVQPAAEHLGGGIGDVAGLVHVADAVGQLHQGEAARLGFEHGRVGRQQPPLGQALGAALGRLLQCPLHHHRQARQAALAHVVGGAALEQLHRVVLADDARDEDEGCVRRHAPRQLQRMRAREARQLVVGQDERVAAVAQCLHEARLVAHHPRVHGRQGARQRLGQQFDVEAGVLQDQHVQSARRRGGSREGLEDLGGRRRGNDGARAIHACAPPSTSRAAAR